MVNHALNFNPFEFMSSFTVTAFDMGSPFIQENQTVVIGANNGAEFFVIIEAIQL